MTMGFFGFLFWLAVAWLVLRAFRRSRYCMAMGSRGYGRVGGWYDSGEFYGPKTRGMGPRRREPAGNQQDYIDALETRVSELENRLDFTERLLAERRDQNAGSVSS
jgi:hypothetical protein